MLLTIEEQLVQNLSLSELWKAIPTMGAVQLIFVLILFSMLIAFLFAVIFRKQIEKLFSKSNLEKYSSYPWPSEEKISIHNLTDKLAKTEKEAKEFKEMLLREIEWLRRENVSGKQFLIDMSKTIYMSESIRKMFRELAEDSIKLNIVRLIYVIHPIKKSKNLNETDKFYLDIKNLCKKYNRPGSWAIKEGINLKLFN
jgi:hypothetical protein